MATINANAVLLALLRFNILMMDTKPQNINVEEKIFGLIVSINFDIEHDSLELNYYCLL